MSKRLIRLFLCLALSAQPITSTLAWENDYTASYRDPLRLNTIDVQRNLDSLNFKRAELGRPLEGRAFLPVVAVPDLQLNRLALAAPEMRVRGLAGENLTVRWDETRFNPDLKLYDGAKASLRLERADGTAAPAVALELGRMSFEPGVQTPSAYTRAYRDADGTSVRVERRHQLSQPNPSHENFVRYHEKAERTAGAAAPAPPTLELPAGFEETWTTPTETYGVRVDALTSDTPLHRTVSAYQGTVRGPKDEIAFTVAARLDKDGRTAALDITLKGQGAPTATVQWKPVEGGDGAQALKLLSDNLPAPLLVGPGSALRLNDVDLPEAPVRLTEEGTLSPQQRGRAEDLANLIGQERLGITVSFAPPAPDEPKPGFSLGNALRNAWYRVTGRWSEVKGLREQLEVMRDQEPGKFVLAAGFSDPRFMSVKDLRTSLAKARDLPPAPDKQIPTGLVVNQDGQEYFRTDQGRLINVTELKRDVGSLRNDWSRSFIPVRDSMAESSQSLVQTLSKLTQADLPKEEIASTWLQSVKNFFVAPPEPPESPSLESEIRMGESLGNLRTWADSRSAAIERDLTHAEGLLANGEIEKAEELFAKSFTEAVALVTGLSEFDHSIQQANASLQALQEVRRYTSPFNDLKTKGSVIDEDLGLVNNMTFTFGDKTPLEMRERATTLAVAGFESLQLLGETGLVNRESVDSLKNIFVELQDDALKGLAAQQRKLGQVYATGNTMESVDDFIGGMVLGSAMPEDETSRAALYGQTAGYLNPYGWIPAARDVLVAAATKDSSFFKGAVKGDFLAEGETNVSALRGQIGGSVLLSLPTSIRDLSRGVYRMANSGLKEGKAEAAINLLGTIPAVTAVARISSFRKLGTVERLAMNEARLTKLGGELKAMQAAGDAAGIERLESRMFATTLRMETIKSLAAGERAVVNATYQAGAHLDEIPKFSSNSEEFLYFLRKTRELDFSTPPNKAVFYSGRGNRTFAEEFAKTNGMHLISSTDGGKYLSTATKNPKSSLTEAQVDFIWKAASQRYARAASGDVVIFSKNADPKRTFHTIELPILRKSNRIRDFIYRETLNDF